MAVTAPQDQRKVVLVTGPAGAGRASAIRVLEDIGFEAIDNMPLRLLAPLIDTPAPERPLALGIDPRTRDFSIDAVEAALSFLGDQAGVVPELLYLHCDTDVLLKRFSETRRRHPLAENDRVEAGIERELAMLTPLQDKADLRIDTSGLTVHELRSEIERHYAPGQKGLLAVSLQSFSYKRGLPRAVDMVFDCRFLRNPYWEPSLRALDGRDGRVQDYVKADPRWPEFETRVDEMLAFLLPAFRDEGKSHLSVAFGCTGGQHRSVAMVENMALTLAEKGWQVSIRHREQNARAASGKQ
jgi:UPF0042 nucleotide-binding protein